MKKKFFSKTVPAIAVLAVLFACALSAPCPAADAGKNSDAVAITLSMRFPPSMLGRGAAPVWDDLMHLQKVLKEKHGVNLNISKQVYWNDVAEMLESGKADIAPLPPYTFASLVQRRPDTSVMPLAAFESGGSTDSRHCIYMLPGEDGLPEYEEPLDLLVGASVAFPDEASWVILNLIFRDSVFRFDASTYMFFFQSFRMLNRESSALAMLFGELDAVLMDELSMKYMIEMDERLEKAVPIKCSDPLPNIMIAVRAGLPKETTDKLLSILTIMNDDPDFKDFRKYFIVTDGRWVSAANVDYTPWRDIVRTARVKGWDKVLATLPVQD